jgi:hypothetical protein
MMWSTILIAPPTYHTETNEDMAKNYPFIRRTHPFFLISCANYFTYHLFLQHMPSQPQGLLNLQRTQLATYKKREM